MTMKREREELHFATSAIEAFNFLERDYGYAVFANDLYHVLYKNGGLTIRIFHGKQSYEIGFEFSSQAHQNGNRYRLPIILKAIDVDASKFERGYFQAHEEDKIRSSLKKLADIVQKYGAKFLLGGLSTFAEIEAVEKAENTRVTDQYSLSGKRKRVEKAWDSGEYEKVVEIYETYKEKLTKLELKRLEYAKRKVNQV